MIYSNRLYVLNTTACWLSKLSDLFYFNEKDDIAKAHGIPKGNGIQTLTFFKYDPGDMSKNAKKISKRAFPRICESLKGVVNNIFSLLESRVCL